jgi:hypothetical protein
MALGAAAPGANGLGRLTPGYEVEVLSQAASRDAGALELSGQALVAAERLGSAERFTFEARWKVGDAFRVLVGNEQVEVSELGRESRYRLLPLLLPRILEASTEAPLVSARLALQLGADVVSQGEFLEDTALRRGYAQLLARLLQSKTLFSRADLEVALQLLEAAGGELAPGAPQRVLVEELVAERRAARRATRATRATGATSATMPSQVAAGAQSHGALERLAARLNFVVPGGDDDAPERAEPPDADEPAGQGRRGADLQPQNGTPRRPAVTPAE